MAPYPGEQPTEQHEPADVFFNHIMAVMSVWNLSQTGPNNKLINRIPGSIEKISKRRRWTTMSSTREEENF
jgi:hypothetical protein